MVRRLVYSVLIFMVLVGCQSQPMEESEVVIDNPTAKEILVKNEDADIFLYNDIVYSNAEDVKWVQEEELTLGEEIGEIQKQTSKGESFENFTASKLEVGTKIYEAIERNGIYIARVNGEEIRYLGLIEG